MSRRRPQVTPRRTPISVPSRSSLPSPAPPFSTDPRLHFHPGLTARPKIVFVDDDNFYANSWIEVLRDRFIVDHYDNAEIARRAIPGTQGVKCIILDVMMPTPSNVPSDETAEGNETGLWVLRELSEYIRNAFIPVIVLTNRSVETVKLKIDEMKFPEDLVDVHFKLDTPRKRLVELVRDKVTRWSGAAD